MIQKESSSVSFDDVEPDREPIDMLGLYPGAGCVVLSFVAAVTLITCVVVFIVRVLG